MFLLIKSAMMMRASTMRLARRAFSSSPSASDAPLERGLPHLISSLQRAFERRHALAAYQEQQVFPPLPLRTLRDLLDFVQLQMPQRTEIDLHEFLEGAAFAGKTQLMAANTYDFALFAGAVESAADDKPATPAPASQAAEQLQTICSPHMFKGLVDASKTALQDKNLIIEIQEMTIDKIFVASVDYSQLTEQDYAELLDGKMPLTRTRSPDATIEHLAIEVNAQTTEVHKMTLVGEEEALVEQQNFRRWLFEARVTTPEQLEWRILAAHGINNGAKEIAPRVYLDKKQQEAEVAAVAPREEPKE